MQLPLIKLVNSQEETISLAEEFADFLNAGSVVALNGELGTGKTFFVKSVLKKYEIENVNSPTFAIVNQFTGRVKVNHFDFYRINKLNELHDIGFDDYLDDESITFIEWANLAQEILPHRRIEVNIKIIDECSREFTFTQLG